MFGDFNEILSPEEKEGGSHRGERQMDAFRETLDDCALRDLGFRGNRFTWQRGKSIRTFVRERLDRAVATECWCELFPRAEVFNSPIYASDHATLIIKGGDDNVDVLRGRKQFIFKPFWLSDAGCAEVVSEAWQEGTRGDVEERV
ncbi:uncharacterized protein LOC141587653 [Silene latifolia]|uniref:uncharacterized protein LOC141587653 n=1 Tax=Silene latifolia TaxID=37657 RepID=UPI003D77E7FA